MYTYLEKIYREKSGSVTRRPPHCNHRQTHICFLSRISKSLKSNSGTEDLKTEAVKMGATKRNEGVFRFHKHLKTAQTIGIKNC
jgi:hypothetical protein